MEQQYRGLGATEAPPMPFNVGNIIAESLSLTVRSAPRWLLPGFLLLAVWAFAAALGVYGLGIDGEVAINLGSLALMIFMPTYTAFFVRNLLSMKRGENIGFGKCMAFALWRTPALFLTGLIIFGAFIIIYAVGIGSVIAAIQVLGEGGGLIGIPIAILFVVAIVYYGFRWQLTAVVAVLEDRKVLDPLRRSMELSRGRVLHIFGAVMATSMIYGMLLMGAVMAGAFTVGMMAAVQAHEAVLFTLGFLVAVVVGVLYLGSILLPITTQFLCYYYITQARELSEDLLENSGLERGFTPYQNGPRERESQSDFTRF